MITVARAGAGLASTDRSLASLGCADIPMECLSLDPDYVVINKVPGNTFSMLGHSLSQIAGTYV